MKKQLRRPRTLSTGRADAMTDEQIHAAALADPDTQPLTGDRSGK